MGTGNNIKIKGYLLACLSAVSYGMIPLFAIPLKETDFSFDVVLFYRFLFGALMIGIYLAIKRVGFGIKFKELGALIFLGVMYALSSHFLFLGYDYMSASVASTILFVYPVFVALIMGLFFREKLSWVMWIAMVLALFGVYVLSTNNGDFTLTPKGLVIVLLSALTYAVYIVVVNKSSVSKISGAKVTFYSMIVCSAFFLVKALIAGELEPIPSVGTGCQLVLFSFTTTVLSLLAMVAAIKFIGSTSTAVLGSMEPVVAVSISIALFHEPLTRNLVMGIALIVVAVTFTVLADKIMRAANQLPVIGGKRRTM